MQYYQVLDRNKVARLVRHAGNAAHDVRNFLCGSNNGEFPELLIIDTLSAQIEAISRDVTSLIYHQYDMNKQMTNAIRCVKLALKTASGFVFLLLCHVTCISFSCDH